MQNPSAPDPSEGKSKLAERSLVDAHNRLRSLRPDKEATLLFLERLTNHREKCGCSYYLYLLYSFMQCTFVLVQCTF